MNDSWTSTLHDDMEMLSHSLLFLARCVLRDGSGSSSLSSRWIINDESSMELDLKLLSQFDVPFLSFD